MSRDSSTEDLEKFYKLQNTGNSDGNKIFNHEAISTTNSNNQAILGKQSIIQKLSENPLQFRELQNVLRNLTDYSQKKWDTLPNLESSGILIEENENKSLLYSQQNQTDYRYSGSLIPESNEEAKSGMLIEEEDEDEKDEEDEDGDVDDDGEIFNKEKLAPVFSSKEKPKFELPSPVSKFGFLQNFGHCDCFEISDKSLFFLNILLKEYKPLEIFFFNLKRALLIPELSEILEKPDSIKEVEILVDEFEKIYEMKKILYDHLSTDHFVLKACLGQIGLMDYFPKKLNHYGHECKLREKLPFNDVNLKGEFNDEMSYFYKNTLNCVFGIWESFFLNYTQEEIDLGGAEDFIAIAFERVHRPLWELVRDLPQIATLYSKLQTNFSTLKDFPQTSCQEVLTFMMHYDLEPDEFHIAIVGNDTKKKEALFQWFIDSTDSTKFETHYLMLYKQPYRDIKIYLYSVTDSIFRVCFFDSIIYSDKVNYPQMDASLKHFTRFSVYCENDDVTACHAYIEFLHFDPPITEKSDTSRLLWRLFGWLADENFTLFDDFKYINS